MKFILFPIFNRLVRPTKILGLSSINSEGEFKFHNFGFGFDTPYYRYEQEDVNDVLRSYPEDSISIFKKGYYTVKNIDEQWKSFKDYNSILWLRKGDILDSFYDPSNYIFKPISYYSKTLRNIYEWKHFDKILSMGYNENVETLIEGSSVLDGYYSIDGQKHYQYFDHYTKGSRFRDVISNSISIEKHKREKIETKGIKVYVDLDSYHLRLIDEKIGNMIPRDIRGHDWLISEVFEKGKEPEVKEQKKLIFTSLYSGNFNMLPCDWTKKLEMKQYKFKSPLGRKGIPFNYIIQEMDVLRMSKYIRELYSNQSKTVLYLYDGVMFDVMPNYLEEFLDKCRKIIDLPFTVNIGKEKVRIF